MLIAVILAAIFVPIAIHWITSRAERAAGERKQPTPARPPLVPAPPPPAQPRLEDRVRALADTGRTIEAIKLVREETDVGLAEAKDAVENIQRRTLSDMSWGRGAGSPLAHDIEATARALLQQDDVLGAIRLVHERTGLGLKEAKEYVDRLR